MQVMSDAQLSTRDVASRLGISTSDLAELRLKTGELPIEQDGLKLFYSADTVQAFERSEALKVMERVLASQSPLATLTRMAQVSGLTRLYIAGQLVAPAIENPTQSSTPDLILPLFSVLLKPPIMRTSCLAAGPLSSVAQTSSG